MNDKQERKLMNKTMIFDMGNNVDSPPVVAVVGWAGLISAQFDQIHIASYYELCQAIPKLGE